MLIKDMFLGLFFYGLLPHREAVIVISWNKMCGLNQPSVSWVHISLLLGVGLEKTASNVLRSIHVMKAFYITDTLDMN